jgi:hypothetical protein
MKYSFDKTSKKFICPSCNKKRFVRFIDIATSNYLDDKYGRCDRETSCGHYNKPETSVATINNYIATPVLTKANNSKTIGYHTEKLLQQTLQQYCNNNFYLYLLELFSELEIQNIFEKYKIGTSKHWKGATVFWQIDNQNKIRAGKILLFERSTCKRVKKPFPHITWVHSKLKQENYNLKQCLFGLHLVNSKTKVAIVESEKTAIIMALLMPEYTWVATGSKQNFKNDILYPIKNNEIIAFPDKSEFKDWQERAISLNKIGYNIKVSDYIEIIECENGTDLADLYIASDYKEKKIELSKDELKVKRIAEINPQILNLIQTFDLCDSFDNSFDIEKIKNYICSK